MPQFRIRAVFDGRIRHEDLITAENANDAEEYFYNHVEVVVEEMR